MQAMVIRRFGGYGVFEPMQLPDPLPGPGQVRIRVVASSINPLELKIRAGLVKAGPDFPAILNGDVSGIVDQVGAGVSRFKPGDAVFGCAGGVKGTQGALADLMLADENLITHAPKSLPLPEAATLPLVFMTAWSALVERARLQPGEPVLIQGGTGGVGHIAVQLAKALGTEVHASVSSAPKAELARSLGADSVMIYTQETLPSYLQQVAHDKGFPVVFDTAGGSSLDQAFQAAAIYGRVVSINTRNSHDLSLMHSKSLTLHVVFRLLSFQTEEGRKADQQRLQKLAELVDTGKIRPLLAARRFHFSEIARAHEYLDSGQAIGKILLLQDQGQSR